MRKLASIRRISNIEPIKKADRIELATVDGWKVVVAKDVGHQVGDLVVYCEIDSFLPIAPEFEFLRKSSYKKMGDREGFRLKTIRLRGQISQGLILPISVLEGKIDFGPGRNFNDHIESLIGQDVSDVLGIVKYDPPIPAQLAGEVKGNFPGFLKKTDQERIQNIDINVIRKNAPYEITEKLDGTSFTCYKFGGKFGVCSRNLELTETEENTYWKVSREHDFENYLRDGFAIQGEIIGPKIQKNRYGLNGPKLYIFDIYDINEGTYLDSQDYEKAFSSKGGILNFVPKIVEMEAKHFEIEHFLLAAEGKSKLNNGTEREGLVWKSKSNPNFSFKTISNSFLLSE